MAAIELVGRLVLADRVAPGRIEIEDSTIVESRSLMPTRGRPRPTPAP